MKKFPILLGFDEGEIIGFVEIEERFANRFHQYTIAPAFKYNVKRKDAIETINFGLVETGGYIKAYQEFEKEINHIFNPTI